MQLYRLDTPSGPVTDMAGDYLSRNLVTARDRARREANERNEPVTLTTITRNGQLRPSLLIQPGGKSTRIHRPRR